MKTTVEALEGNKVKLSIEVEEGEFDGAVDRAFRKIAREVRIPGFRPGKAPRPIIEARVGKETARQEALRDALPGYYEQALRENDLEPIAPPEIDITAGQDEGPVVFDAVIQLMPQVSIAGYSGLRVVMRTFDITEEDIDMKLDMTRDNFAELRPVPRAARTGDHVSMDRRITRHDETLQAVEDELYEIGSRTGHPEVDDQLRGAKAGDILKFNIEDPQAGEATFHILVKEVREKVLPEVTDEWASEASEFDTVAELRENIREQLRGVRKVEAAFTIRGKVIEALVELVDEEMPDTLVADEMQRRLGVLVNRITEQGADFKRWLEATGRSQEDLFTELRAEAIAGAKADLALRAVADLEDIQVGDDELDVEVAAIATRQERSVDEVLADLDREGKLPLVRSGLRKSKALEWLIGHTEYVDEEGHVIDRSEFVFDDETGTDPPETPPDTDPRRRRSSAGDTRMRQQPNERGSMKQAQMKRAQAPMKRAQMKRAQ